MATANPSQPSLLLLHGPPGTGKTTTLVEIDLKWLFETPAKGILTILVCAPSNKAANVIFGALLSKFSEGNPSTRLSTSRIVRFGTLSEEEHLRVQHIDELTNKKCQEVKNFQLPTSVVNMAREKILKEAQVIVTTFVGAGNHELKKLYFTHGVLDEAGQAIEPETYILLVKVAEGKVVMAGDYLQLDPTVISKKAHNGGLRMSLFERLKKLEHRDYVMLDEQHRFNSVIAGYISKQFYDGQLRTACSDQERTLRLNGPLLEGLQRPLSVYRVISGVTRNSGASKDNPEEARVVKFLYKLYEESGVNPENIPILVPYAAQVLLLRSLNFCSTEWICTVDRAHGDEADVVIFSAVRDLSKDSLGFVTDPKRVNVTVSRARMAFVLVGCPEALEKDPTFHDLFAYIENDRQNMFHNGH